MNAKVIPFPARQMLPQPQAETSPDIRSEDEWDQVERLYSEVQRLLRDIGDFGRNEQRAINFLRYHFSVSSHTELTIGDMKKAVPMLEDTIRKCQVFRQRVREMEQVFDEQVVGRGAPWTPAIARKVGSRRMRQLGAKVDWQMLATELQASLKRSG